ncbi:hypothetical protein [Flavobacterium sp.]|uniref:hypothetical protein n=1 Tax=Flavobacterium sp. TaxID=239 RepID=UPI00286AA9B2|nr:hypothetical protein [Flavobacterium sp.]
MQIRNKISNPKSQFQKFIFGICFLFFAINAQSQCAMCRASLESTGNVTQAEAINDGIVYLMIIPYILVAIVGFGVYRIYLKKK